MNKIAFAIVCFMIIGSSYFSRFNIFQTSHPDDDELFELTSLQTKSPQDMLKNNNFYGDHTSFPGEYIIHYVPMQLLRLFDKPASIDIQTHTIKGISKIGFWILAIPKILLSILATFLFVLCYKNFIKTEAGAIIALCVFMFNGHILYHSFSLRPYGILPELAIMNFWACRQQRNDQWFSIGHGLLIFFTCIYHAYGILIAYLPCFYFLKNHQRTVDFGFICLASIGAWIYYAAYSNLGFSPNKVQSVVDAFAFMHKQSFLDDLIKSLFMGLILTTILPIILLSCAFIKQREIIFGVFFILFPLALIIAVDIKTSYWIHPRQYIWLVPYLAIWSGMVIDRLIQRLEIL